MRMSIEEIRKTVDHAKQKGWIKCPAQVISPRIPTGKMNNGEFVGYETCQDCMRVVEVRRINGVKRLSSHRIQVQSESISRHWKRCDGSDRVLIVSQV